MTPKAESKALRFGQRHGLLEFGERQWWVLNMSGGRAQAVTRTKAIEVAIQFMSHADRQRLGIMRDI